MFSVSVSVSGLERGRPFIVAKNDFHRLILLTQEAFELQPSALSVAAVSFGSGEGNSLTLYPVAALPAILKLAEKNEQRDENDKGGSIPCVTLWLSRSTTKPVSLPSREADLTNADLFLGARVLALARLGAPMSVFGRLYRASNNGKDLIPQQAFEEQIREALPGKSFSKVDRVLLSAFFTTLFELVARQRGGADYLDLFLALLPLADGSKGEKLADAWRLLANSELEALPKRQVWRLFRSFLSCFRALVDCMAAAQAQQQQQQPPSSSSPLMQEMRQSVEDAALEATSSVFLIASATATSAATPTSMSAADETSTAHLKRITLGALAEVYNGAFEAVRALDAATTTGAASASSSSSASVASSEYGGVDKAAAAAGAGVILKQLGWFELLDSRKWPVIPLLGLGPANSNASNSKAASGSSASAYSSSASATNTVVIDARRPAVGAASSSAAPPQLPSAAPAPAPAPAPASAAAASSGFSYAAMARRAVTEEDRKESAKREEAILRAEAMGLDASTVAEKQIAEGGDEEEGEEEEEDDILPSRLQQEHRQQQQNGDQDDDDDDTYEAEKNGSSSARGDGGPEDVTEEDEEQQALAQAPLDSTTSSFETFPGGGSTGLGHGEDEDGDADAFPSSSRRGPVLLSLEVVPASDLSSEAGSTATEEGDKGKGKQDISLSFAEEDIMSLALFRRLTALDASSHLNGVKAAALAAAIALGRRAKLLPGFAPDNDGNGHGGHLAFDTEEDEQQGQAVSSSGGGFHHGVTIATTISSTAAAGLGDTSFDSTFSNTTAENGAGATAFPTNKDLRSIALNPESSLASGGLSDVPLGALDVEAIVAGLFPVARLSDQQLAACLKVVYSLASILSPRTLVPKKHHHDGGGAAFSSASSMSSFSSLSSFGGGESTADEDGNNDGEGEKKDGGHISAAKLLWRPRVPAVDLAAALLCLSSGSKSDKLATLFSLYGVKPHDGEEVLMSRTALYAAFRPALAVLLITSNGVLARLVAGNTTANSVASASSASGLTAQELRTLSARIEVGAVHAAASVVVGAQMLRQQQQQPHLRVSSDGKPLVSFSDLSEYYNQGGGSSDLPWLELLDLSKLEAVLLASSSSSSAAMAADAHEKDQASVPRPRAAGAPLAPATAIKSRPGLSSAAAEGASLQAPQLRPAESSAAVYLAHVQGAPTVFRMPLLSSVGGKNALAAPPFEDDDNEDEGAGVEGGSGAEVEEDREAEKDFILLGYGSVAFVEYAAEASGLNKLTPTEMHAKAKRAFGEDAGSFSSRLDELAFLKLLRGILAPSALGGSTASVSGTTSAASSPNSKAQAAAKAIASQRTLLSRFLLRLYKALDFAGVGTVATVDVLIALSAFTAGSKSDKLSYAFALLGSPASSAAAASRAPASPSSGPILRRGQLFRFLRDLFVFLSLAQEVGAELDLMALAGAREEAQAKKMREQSRNEGFFGIEGGAYLDDEEEQVAEGEEEDNDEEAEAAVDPMRSALLSPQRKSKAKSRLSAATRTRAAHAAYASSLASSSQASSVATGDEEVDVNADLRARARIRSAKQRLRLVTQAANAHAGAILSGAHSAALAVAAEAQSHNRNQLQLPLEVLERGRAVTLLGMARFYNQAGGFSLSPYLELLSVAKWQLPEQPALTSVVEAFAPSAASKANSAAAVASGSHAAQFAAIARQAAIEGLQEAEAASFQHRSYASVPAGHDIVFSFSLESAADAAQAGKALAISRLNVSVGACITVYRLAQASGFSMLTPASLVRVIRSVWGKRDVDEGGTEEPEAGSVSPVASASFSSGRLVRRTDFRELCGAVSRVAAALRGNSNNASSHQSDSNSKFALLQHVDSGEEQQWCAGMLDILFDCLATHPYPRSPQAEQQHSGDGDGDGDEEEGEDGEMTADAAELAVALSLFTAGSKSEKLAALWSHLCEGIAARRASAAADSASKEAALSLIYQKKAMAGDDSSVGDADATASVEEAAIEAGAEAAEAAAAVIVGESALPVSEIAVLLKGAVSALAVLCTAADSASSSASSSSAASSFSALVQQRLEASQSAAQSLAMSVGLGAMSDGTAILDQEASGTMKDTHRESGDGPQGGEEEEEETSSLLFDVVTALVPYRSFASWYNQHVGTKHKDEADISWLELLDLSKWSAWLPSRTYERNTAASVATASSQGQQEAHEGEEVKDSSFDYAEEALSNTSSALTAEEGFASDGEGEPEHRGIASSAHQRLTGEAGLKRETPVFRFALPGFSSKASAASGGSRSVEGFSFNVLVTLADVQRLLTLAQLFSVDRRDTAEVFVAFAEKEAEVLDKIPEGREQDEEEEDEDREPANIMRADTFLAAAAEAFELVDASDAAFRFAAGSLLAIYECFGYQEVEEGQEGEGQYVPVSKAASLLPPPTSLDLAAAVALLSAGNKSEKLGLSWRLFTSDIHSASMGDREKGIPLLASSGTRESGRRVINEDDAYLDATQLARLFRAFLASVVGLSALQEQVSGLVGGAGARTLDESEAAGPIALAAVEAAQAVVAFAERKRERVDPSLLQTAMLNKTGTSSAVSPLSGSSSSSSTASSWPKGMVPFSVFKLWYNGSHSGQDDEGGPTRGHNVIPFIELLSLEKWVAAAEAVLAAVPPSEDSSGESARRTAALARAKAQASSHADALVASLMAKALNFEDDDQGVAPAGRADARDTLATTESLSEAEAAFERALAAVENDGMQALDARASASAGASGSNSGAAALSNAYRRYVEAALSEAAAAEAAADAAATQAQNDQESLGGGSGVTGSTDTTALGAGQSQHYTDKAALLSSSDGADDAPAPVFGFILSSEGHLVRVTARDVLAYHYFRSKSGLSFVEPKDVFEFLIRLAEDQEKANTSSPSPSSSAFGPCLTALEFQAAVKILGDAAKPASQQKTSKASGVDNAGDDENDDENDDDDDDPVLDVLQFVFDILACAYNAPHHATAASSSSVFKGAGAESSRVVAPSERKVPAVALAAAIAAFASGSKSLKLALAYKAFEVVSSSSTGSAPLSSGGKSSGALLDPAQHGAGLGKPAFAAFLLSLLVPVLVFGLVEPAESSSPPSQAIINAAGGSAAAASIYKVAADCSGEVAFVLLRDPDDAEEDEEGQGQDAHSRHYQRLMPFGLFAEYYNSAGWSLLGWLELLTPAKWDAATKGDDEEDAPGPGPRGTLADGSSNKHNEEYLYPEDENDDDGSAEDAERADAAAQTVDDGGSSQGYGNESFEPEEVEEELRASAPVAPLSVPSQTPASSSELVLDIGLLVKLGSSVSAAHYSRVGELFSSTADSSVVSALRLTTGDAAHIARLAHLTRFHVLPTTTVASAVREAARKRADNLRRELHEQSAALAAEGDNQASARLMRASSSLSEELLDKRAFNAAVRTLLDQASASSSFPIASLSQGQRDYLSFSLSSIFFALEEASSSGGRDGSSAVLGGADASQGALVPVAEVATALSLLATGNKAAKLSQAWALFDEDGDGLLSPGEMTRLLRSFLACLLALREPPLVSLLTSSRPSGINDASILPGGVTDHDIFSVFEDPIAVSLSARAAGPSARARGGDDGADDDDEDGDDEDTRLTVVDPTAVRRLAAACAFGVVEAWHHDQQKRHGENAASAAPLVSLSFISDFYNSGEAKEAKDGQRGPSQTGSAALRWFELLQLGKWVPLEGGSNPLRNAQPQRSDQVSSSNTSKGDEGLVNSSFASAPTGSDRSTTIGDLLRDALGGEPANDRSFGSQQQHHALLPRSSSVSSASSSVVGGGASSSSSVTAADTAFFYTPADAQRVVSLSQKTGLASLDAAQVASTALAMARKEAEQVITQTLTRGQKEGDGSVQVQDEVDGGYLLSLQCFKSLLRKLLPGVASLDPQERLRISASLLNLYTSLQHGLKEAEGLPVTASNSSVGEQPELAIHLPERLPAASVTAALCLLCGGSKSSKLAALFAAFDADSDGSLTQRQLALLFASILLGLVGVRQGSFSEGTQHQERVELAAAQAGALLTAEKLAADAFDWVAESGPSAAGVSLGKARADGGARQPEGEEGEEEGLISCISFPAFAAAYNAVGYPSLAFLELLNLDKLSSSS